MKFIDALLLRGVSRETRIVGRATILVCFATFFWIMPPLAACCWAAASLTLYIITTWLFCRL